MDFFVFLWFHIVIELKAEEHRTRATFWRVKCLLCLDLVDNPQVDRFETHEGFGMLRFW
jgi:hypothetical protein